MMKEFADNFNFNENGTSNKCFDSTQICNEQQGIKINRIRALMIATLADFIENIYYCYIVLLAQ